MPKPPARSRSSDAELGAKILAAWEHMSQAVPDGPRHNRRMAEHFGVGVPEIQHVRDVRNSVAHPDEPISRQDLERALAVIRRARKATAPAGRQRKPARATGTATRSRPATKARPAAKTRTATKPRPARKPRPAGKPRPGNRSRPQNRKPRKPRTARKQTAFGTLWRLAVDHWGACLVALGLVVAFALVLGR